MIPRIIAPAAADLERVTKAGCRQQPDFRASSFQQCIGGDGGAVHKQRGLRQQCINSQTEALSGTLQRFENPLCGVGIVGRRFDRVDVTAPVDNPHIRERAADVHANAERSRSAFGLTRNHIPILKSIFVVTYFKYCVPNCMSRDILFGEYLIHDVLSAALRYMAGPNDRY